MAIDSIRNKAMGEKRVLTPKGGDEVASDRTAQMKLASSIEFAAARSMNDTHARNVKHLRKRNRAIFDERKCGWNMLDKNNYNLQ